MTRLLDSPFAIIDASAHDDKKRIVELAEEKSFIVDPEVCNKARSDLTSPRSRISAELGWLPGVGPSNANEFLTALRTDPATLRIGKIKIMPIAAANLLTACLEYFDETVETDQWIGWILDIAETVEKIDALTVLRGVNGDRKVSGFPEIRDVDLIQNELVQRRRFYNEEIVGSLDRLEIDTKLKIITGAVESATELGEKHGPALIDQLVDSYALQIHSFLASEAEIVMAAVEAARESLSKNDKQLRNRIQNIERLVRHWDKYAQPVQLSLKSRGLPHELSAKIAVCIRELAIILANEHDLYDLAAELTNLIREVFAESPVLVERIEEDAQDLKNLSRQKQQLEGIGPVKILCDSALKKIVEDPQSAAKQGQKVFSASQKLLSDMRLQSAPNENIAFAENYVARTLITCAIAYGNATEKWSPSLKLLEIARDLIHDDELLTRLNTNLDIVKVNLRKGGGLGKLSSAPNLSTINGFGFSLYGSSDPDPENGSSIATYYFVALFIPVFPIARYRVTRNGNSYNFLGKYPLRTFDWWHLAISFVTIGLVILYNQ